MENQEVQDAIEQGLLIQRVDGERASGDRFKLPAEDKTLFDARLADLMTQNVAVRLSESGRAGDSKARGDAIKALEVLLHDGYNHIKALKSYDITPADRRAVYVAYGWAGGEVGDFDEARILSLSRGANDASTVVDAAYRYPAALLTRLAEQIAIVEGSDLANGGDRAKMTETRKTSFEIFEKSLSRVRFYYCSASDDTDQTTELTRIGFQRRRNPGEVQHSEATPTPTLPTP